jgi:hypothetical protein
MRKIFYFGECLLVKALYHTESASYLILNVYNLKW